jgi:hypothetical protein
MTSFISYIFKDTKKKLALFAIPVLHFPMLEKKVNRYLLPQRKQGRAGISEPRGNRNDIIHLIHFQVHKEKADAFCNTSASFSNVGKESQPLFFTAKKVREGLERASHAGTTITFSHSTFFKDTKKKLTLFAGSAPSITRSLHKNLTAKGRKEGAKEFKKAH